MNELTNVSSPIGALSDATEGGQACLVLVSSPAPGALGRVLPLDRDELDIGRGTEVALRLEDQGISRRHAQVRRLAEGGFEIRDLESRNGVWVNGQRVDRAVLRDGDRIRIGDFTALRFSRDRQADERRDAQLRQALAAAKVGTWEFGIASGMVVFSEQVDRILGLPAGALSGRAEELGRLIHPDDQINAVAAIQRSGEHGARLDIEFQMMLPDGGTRWVACQGEVLRGADDRPVRITGTIMDVSDRKLREQELRRYAFLFESLSDGVVVSGTDGRIADWNPAAEQLFGHKAAEVRDRNWLTVLQPEGAEDLVARIDASLTKRGRWSSELRLRSKDGTERTCESVVVPLRDGQGRAIAQVAIHRDISEKKQMEARLMLADRMASVGTLAAGVAHEINNPLAFVIANLAFIDDEIERHGKSLPPALVSEWQQCLRETRVGVDRIRSIVRDLKQLSTRDGQEDKVGPVDLNQVLGFSLKMVENEIRHRAMVVRELGEVPPVLASEARLSQVFLNLLMNAAQAIPEGSAVKNSVRVVTRVDPSGRVIAEISDTGIGIPADVLGRIFDPFFTTKPIGVGMGLGLSVCHAIIVGFGGEISVESEPGKGSTFRVTLARSTDKADMPTTRPGLPRPEEELRARLLVVDDEPLVGESIVRLLRRDHDARAVTDGAEVLRMLARGERFDLILCDLMMPTMSGQELHDQVAGIDAEQARKMVFFTGGAFTPAAGRFWEQLPDPKLRKPIEPKRLQSVIHDLLAGLRLPDWADVLG